MFSFKKTQRLLHKTEYDTVFLQAKKIISSEFVMLYRANKLGHARLGLALSKKMIAKAHDRNRIKRILREQFRTMNLPSVDLIFLARPGVGKHTNKALSAKLSKTWEKLTSCYNT